MPIQEPPLPRNVDCAVGTVSGRSVVGLLSWIIVGIIAGWLAEKISARDHGLLTNLVVGIIGALIGGFLVTTLLGYSFDRGVNLTTIGVATLGATLLLWIRGQGAVR